MAYQIALSFEDGVTRFVDCADHETVAEAAYKARINIPLDCRDGACGTCKSVCEKGSYDGGDYIDEALSDEEAEAGYVLPCQMTPHSDLVLRIPATSASAKSGPAVFTATVTEIDRHSPTTVGFTLEADDREALGFLPGQYVNVTVPGAGVSRSYSFSSGPDQKHLSFLVRITEGGAMSEYLRGRAQTGDRVEFTGPMGAFFLREIDRPALMLAGGTGIAPLLSMLESLAQVPPAHPVRLLYGVTTDQDLVHLESLRDYAEVIPGFTFDHCVAHPTGEASNKGLVTDLLEASDLHGGDADVYLCGPPPMVEAVHGRIREIGVEPAGFYYEKFTNAAVPGAAAQAGTAQAGTAQAEAEQAA